MREPPSVRTDGFVERKSDMDFRDASNASRTRLQKQSHHAAEIIDKRFFGRRDIWGR